MSKKRKALEAEQGQKIIEIPATADALPRLAFTVIEAATILGISYNSVYRLTNSGKLKYSNALKRRMIPKTEIEAFLKRTTVDRAA